MHKVAMYARVSTADGQTVECQLVALREEAARRGWDAEVFVDEGISGAKGRDRRPGFDALCRAVEAGEVGMVAAWSVDRLGRSLQDLIGFLGLLHARGCGLYLHQQGLDTSTPAGRAMFQMLGVFAEFERALIRERTMAGLARARAEGRVPGRRPTVPEEVRAAVREARARGCSLRECAAWAGTRLGTARRVLAAGA
jgi:DNA invertase Pin-like site-specific DNA recombinase